MSDYDDQDDWDDDYEPEEDEIMSEDDQDMEMAMEDIIQELAEDDDEETVAIDLRNLFSSTSPTTARNRALIERLLGQAGAAQLVTQSEEDDEDSDGLAGGWWPSHGRHYQYEPDTEPQDAGVALLNSGEFGPTITKQPLQRSRNEAKRSLSLPVRSDLYRDIVPNTIGTVVARYGSNAYAGQFSTDSAFFYTCVQDFRLHIYDTKAPMLRKPLHDGDHVYTMKHTKTIRGCAGGWTITDQHLSPDNSLLAYAVMSPNVFLAPTGEDDESEQRSLYFGNDRGGNDWHDHYGIWSCRFSGDGKELVAGGSGKLMVYDLQANRRSVKIEAHRADVNSCCFADNGGNVLLSASDDTFLKVWDRRSLRSSSHPAGVLVGHTEGLTYVSPKGDGRYVISNGKDQTLRLWDLRKMVSFDKWKDIRRDEYGIPSFDYRAQVYPKPRYERHPLDCSVMSYRGHSVLRTLIRCNFSPAETTGSRYIYSGSSDGMVHIWSLDGTVVQKIDRRHVIEMGHDPSDTEAPAPESDPLPARRNRHNQTVVRDVAWHSQEPVLMTCSWASDRRHTSDVAKHEWKGLNKLGGRLEDFVAREAAEARERRLTSVPSLSWI